MIENSVESRIYNVWYSFFLNPILASLPLLVLLLVWLVRALSDKQQPLRIRRALLEASLIVGAGFAVSAEGLGYLHLFNTGAVRRFWAIALVVAGGGVFFFRARISELLSNTWSLRKGLRVWEIALLCAMGAVATWYLGVVVRAAVLTPPNSWDGMTYHLPRAMHWIQNETLAHYPTNIRRQLFHNPFASYVHAELILLDGSDRWNNLIQFICMALSLVAVSAIAAQLGASRLTQGAAALIALSIPEGILEASGTLTDHVLSIWLLSALFFLLDGKEEKVSGGMRQVVFLSLSAALAISTKGTAFLFLAPIAVVYAWRNQLWQIHKEWKVPLVAVLIVLLINAPLWLRNFELFGQPLGPTSGAVHVGSYRNDEISVANTISNALRNLSLHLISQDLLQNQWWIDAISKVHEVLAIPLNQPGNTWMGTSFPLNEFKWDENMMPNQMHLWAILAVLLVAPLLMIMGRGRGLAVVLGVLLAQWVLFFAYLKWQPWHTRLHLPLFVESAPLIAVVAGRLFSSGGAVALAAVFIFYARPAFYFNMHRPLRGEGHMAEYPPVVNMFRAYPDIRPSYQELFRIGSERRCASVGLITGEDTWEYPLWAFWRDKRGRRPVFRHIVENANETDSTAPELNFHPCLIVSFDALTRESLIYHDRFYRRIFDDWLVAVYERVGKIPPRNE